jgi:catechol 2,3-dioxygenase-like lactoylglutathione lyase family enzyme
VPDLDAALAFYSSKLGHKLISRSNVAAGLKLHGSRGRVLRGPFEIEIGRCAIIADLWDNILVILDASKGTLQVDENRHVIGRRST